MMCASCAAGYYYPVSSTCTMLCASCACWLLLPVSSPVQCCVLAVPVVTTTPVSSPVQCCLLAVPAGYYYSSILTCTMLCASCFLLVTTIQYPHLYNDVC
ncbi:hypothetical protein DPMN_076534 [Dreissena polymorpha]|uniref:Uncharacterized protein n=1 Tax=Dreissena polymorpha TaxID=45954 RepID=A0A9D3YLP0_DREPO|nr:hypothetical protein DPMN_076534 [Dreissena polymorpha]